MKLISSPTFWLFFGFVGYPIICALDGGLFLMAISQLGLVSGNRIHESMWMATVSIIAWGVPLGLVSMYSAIAWRHRWFRTARWLALLGGAFSFILWFPTTIGSSLKAWWPFFGFLLPLLTWSACLIFFAVYARRPKGET